MDMIMDLTLTFFFFFFPMKLLLGDLNSYFYLTKASAMHQAMTLLSYNLNTCANQ